MARVRRPGLDPEEPRPLGSGADRLGLGPSNPFVAALLTARRFRIGPGADRIAAHLRQHGGEVDPDQGPLVTSGPSPSETPTLGLGPHAGTLGPFSFGFLNVGGRVAALDAPLPRLPAPGRLGVVVPRRAALPEIVPLCLERDLALSFLVSTGDGDPTDTIAFLNEHPDTHAISIVLGRGASGPGLRRVLGVKPTVVWTEDPLARAIARRAGVTVVDQLDAWLAHSVLLSRGVTAGTSARVLVRGAGEAVVARALRGAGLEAPLECVDERNEAALLDARRSAEAAQQLLIEVTSAHDAPLADGSPAALPVDLRHPEAMSALFEALATRPEDDAPPARALPTDGALLRRLREELGDEVALGDHDCKRLLKGWGVRVSRQAPAPTPTAALKLARTIGLPVDLQLGADGAAELRICQTLPEVRQAATMLLGQASEQVGRGEVPSLVVREHFAEQPRVRLLVRREVGLGLVLEVGAPQLVANRRARDDERGDRLALLPLTHRQAERLAASAGARRAAMEQALVALFLGVSACASEEQAELTLDVALTTEPAVVAASGRLVRPLHGAP